MLFESNFYYVLGAALIIVLIFTIGYKFWKGIPDNEFEKSLMDLKIMLFSISFLAFIFMLMLPSPPFLNPLTVPETIGDSRSNEQLLSYVKDLSLAVERIRDVIHYFLLIFVVGFLGAVYQVTKVYSKLSNQKK